MLCSKEIYFVRLWLRTFTFVHATDTVDDSIAPQTAVRSLTAVRFQSGTQMIH